MDVEELMVLLTDKDKQQAYGALQAFERISEQSDVLYSYTRQFAAMVKSEQYMLRVRGFRLFCKQARWDKEEVIDETIVQVLTILQDEKPTAVRQALAALQEVVGYKPALWEPIGKAVGSVDVYRYKDSMRSLLEKDMQALLAQMKQE